MFRNFFILIIALIISAASLYGDAIPNPKIIPTPQETYWGNENLKIGESGRIKAKIDYYIDASDSNIISFELDKRLKRHGIKIHNSENAWMNLTFTTNSSKIPEDIFKKYALDTAEIGNEGYIICVHKQNNQNKAVIYGKTRAALLYGMVTFVKLINLDDNEISFPEVTIVDYPILEDRGLLVDLGGQGFMVGPSRWDYEQWKDFIDWMVDHKLNFIHLEFIGSGRLMGNLDMDKNEWCGFPIDLESYPEFVCKNRPIKRWDHHKQKVVEDRYTAPNVENEFVDELIDYCHQRGVRAYIFVGYDYFAKQLPVLLRLPHNDPTHPGANKFYDIVLREITQRYKNAKGVVMTTIEAKHVPEEMIITIAKRMNDAYEIIRAINPEMEIYLLADYLRGQENVLEQLQYLKDNTPDDFSLSWSPHAQPYQKSWKRAFGNILKYSNYTQYAWEKIVYIFPEQIYEEIYRLYADGYRGLVSQAWYFSTFSLNFLAMAEYTWNLTSCPTSEFWDKALTQTFGSEAKPFMDTALRHTRFDRRFDVLIRQIIEGKMDRVMTYWDMYVYHNSVVNKQVLEELKADAKTSLMAAQTALPLVKESSKPMVDLAVISAERRYYFASSAIHLLDARELYKSRKKHKALKAIELSIQEGEKLLHAAHGLGIEFPMSVHDDEYVEKLKEFQKTMKDGTYNKKLSDSQNSQSNTVSIGNQADAPDD